MTTAHNTADLPPGPLMTVADQFKPGGRVAEIREYGNGNVHDTFLVSLDSASNPHFILQRFNTRVFRQPELVMQNLRTLTEHVHDRLQHVTLGAGRRWEVPRVIVAQDGRDCWIGPDGSFWRAISFIDGAHTHETIQDTEHAGEVGYALGMFHYLISDLVSDRLADTLQGFHIAPGYLRHYDEVLVKSHARQTPEVNYASQFVSERRVWAHVLEQAKEQGKLRLRPIHGDPKVNNVLLDDATGKRFPHRERLLLSVRCHPVDCFRAGIEVFHRPPGRQCLFQGQAPGAQSCPSTRPIQAHRKHRIPDRCHSCHHRGPEMNQGRFSLEPFPTSGPVPGVEITGSIARRSHTLVLEYDLRGPVAEFAIPAPSDAPARKSGLWQETCFEFFLAPRSSPRYWEFNLSPAGHWNAYRFAGYRQGMQEESALVSLPFGFQCQSNSLRLTLELDLESLVPPDQALEVAISAVLHRRDGAISYWALTHCGPQPDFHHRDSFVLVLG
jgi:hypothetical protein